MKAQPIKKVKVEMSTPESPLIDDNYCPHDVIGEFFDKYSLFSSRDMLNQMSIAADMGIIRAVYITEAQRNLDAFHNDVYELFGAIYFEHRYNTGKPKIVFVKEAENEVV